MTIQRIPIYPRPDDKEDYLQRLWDAMQQEASSRVRDFDLLRISNVPWVDVRAYGAKGDGSTDDTVAIQAAENSLSSGGIVYLPQGTYVTSSTLSISSNITILGQGFNTWIKNTTLNGNVILLDGVTDVRFVGFKVSGTNNASHTNNQLIRIQDACSRVLLDGIYATQSGRNGISVQQTATSTNATNIWIRNCWSTANQYNGIFINGAINSSVVDCILTGNGVSDTNGYGLILDCYYQNICQNIRLEANTITGNGEGGCRVLGGKHIHILYNDISDNGETGWSAGDGIGLFIEVKEVDETEMCPKYFHVIGNNIEKNYDIGLLAEGMDNSWILHNYVANSAYGNASNRTGILLRPSDENYENCHYNKVFFNTVIKDDASSKQDYGIEVLTNDSREAKYNIVGLNHCSGNLTASYNSDCQEQNIIFDMDDAAGLIRTRGFNAAGCADGTTNGYAKTTNAVTYEIQGKVYSKAATDNLFDLTEVSTDANEYKKVLLCLNTSGNGQIVEGKIASSQANALLPTLGRNAWAVVGVVEITQSYSGGDLSGATFYDIVGEYRR